MRQLYGDICGQFYGNIWEAFFMLICGRQVCESIWEAVVVWMGEERLVAVLLYRVA